MIAAWRAAFRHRAVRVLLDMGNSIDAVAMLRNVLLSGEEGGSGGAPLSRAGAECVQLLGAVALALGDFDAAFEHSTRVLRSVEETEGPRSVAAAEALSSSAEILFRQGLVAEALQAFCVVRDILAATLGPRTRKLGTSSCS
jgi:hypothetical protein